MIDNKSQEEHEILLAQQKGIFEQHIYDSYFNLRAGIAVLAILLPLVLLIWGYTVEGYLRDSMSDYYLDDNGRSMRDWFVGNLWVLAGLLALCRMLMPVHIDDRNGGCATNSTTSPTESGVVRSRTQAPTQGKVMLVGLAPLSIVGFSFFVTFQHR